MTIEQRKIALINWITELDDEGLIRYMEELLQLSNAVSKSDRAF